VLVRESTKATFPSSITVKKVDFTSLESLTSALNGQDAVVSTVGTDGLLGQKLVINASISAGVKRFLPSEFGSDLANPLAAALPVFGYKVEAEKHLEAAIAKQSGEKMTYTYFRNSIFLDWGLEHDFFFDSKTGHTKLYDGGDQLFSTTSLATVGKGVVGVLTHYEETKDRGVYVHDIGISQKRLVELAKKVAPEKAWTSEVVSTAELKAKSDAALAKGDYSFAVMTPYLMSSIWAEGYGGYYAKVDNEMLGVPVMTEDDVVTVIKKVLT
jgi:hypothetical protein